MKTAWLACFGAMVATAGCAQTADAPAVAAKTSGSPVASAGEGHRAAHADAATIARVKSELSRLVACKSELDCDAFDSLVDLGDVAAPEVLSFVADRSHGDARRLAARVLGRMHYAPAGPPLVALGNGEPDVMAQMDLLRAAGDCGGDATFDALAAEYAREIAGAPGEHLVALRDGLRAFHTRALPWALEAMTRGDTHAEKYADVLCDVAKPADRDTLVALVGRTKNYRVDDRLAAKALALGATDDKLYDTLLAGLESENADDRSDAATLLRVVSRQLPESRKQKAVELLHRAMIGANPALASNLQQSLVKLGG
jgi:hypothetical protein|nr:hypothetical protein [Kofleriaceae bacterium]